ncbi:MAG: phosphoglucosamine mutase, partial [Elusimicrobia bacterium]|nr:phosphoglucosamine mutase [Elusimicrobiota bacterium]
GVEEEIEERLRRGEGAAGRAAAAGLARPRDGTAQAGLYLDFLRSTFPAELDLSGMTLVVDCANGASSAFAPRLFEGLGARVIPLSCRPDGGNINAGCGALFPEAMRRAVVRRKAQAGVCFDGDADRAIFADEKGRLLDGDRLICLGALRLHERGLLRNDRVVLTVMSNIGLVNSLKERGIEVVSVPVGDRNVTEAIERGGLSIGGESSGHVIFRSFAVTGDGMLTALQTLAAMRESGKPLSATREAFRPVPQALRNLHCGDKPPLERLPRLQKALRRCRRELGERGRVLLRYSGTEPLLRIMVEGPDRARVAAMADELSAAFRAASQKL